MPSTRLPSVTIPDPSEYLGEDAAEPPLTESGDFGGSGDPNDSIKAATDFRRAFEVSVSFLECAIACTFNHRYIP